jgi:hypothetical protein
MPEDADSEHQKRLWDAALESIGRDTVRVVLNHCPRTGQPPSSCRARLAANAGTPKTG